MHDSVNISDVIGRIKEREGLRFNKDVAAIWNLSESDFNNRKRRGTLLSLFVDYAIEKGWSLDWLLKGNGPGGQHQTVSEPAAHYCTEEEFMAQWPEEIKNACRQLKRILLSDHPVIKPALISNLAAFQYSIEKEKSQDDEIRKLSRRLKFLEDRHKAERSSGIEGAASSSTGKPET